MTFFFNFYENEFKSKYFIRNEKKKPNLEEKKDRIEK